MRAALIQPGRFVLPGEMAGAPALQFFRGPTSTPSAKPMAQADKHSNAGMLRERYEILLRKGW